MGGIPNKMEVNDKCECMQKCGIEGCKCDRNCQEKDGIWLCRGNCMNNLRDVR